MSEIIYRHFKYPDDLEALVHLKNTYFRHYQIDRVTDVEKQKRLLSYPGHEPERDNYVAVVPGNYDLLAHIWLWEQSAGRFLYDLHVHPDWERKTIGTNLLHKSFEHVRAHGGKHLDTQVSDKNTAHLQFCQKMGFRQAGSYFHMVLDSETKLPDLTEFREFTIRSYSAIDDIYVYTRVMNEAYGDLWGHMSNVSTDLVAKSLDYFDPDCIYFLFDGEDNPSGFARIHYSEDDGICMIDAPGVLPDYRSPDLYRYLVIYSVHQLKSRMKTAQDITMDSWGDFDSTLTMFRDIGFISRQHKIGFRYDL